MKQAAEAGEDSDLAKRGGLTNGAGGEGSKGPGGVSNTEVKETGVSGGPITLTLTLTLIWR